MYSTHNKGTSVAADWFLRLYRNNMSNDTWLQYPKMYIYW